MTTSDYSPGFYREYAGRYAEVAGKFIQSVYTKTSHPKLRHDWDLWDRLMDLAPGRRGLDAGCGAGARDVLHACSEGYDVVGIDAIEENIQAARALHEEIADRVFVADLTTALPFDDVSFDFVACNAVIQHIDPGIVQDVVLPEFARVLRPGGVLELMFKCGEGVITVFDKDYGIDRTFRLYRASELLEILQGLGLSLIESESPEQLGGLLYFTDPKPVDHCVFFARKAGAIHSLNDPASIASMTGDKRTELRVLLRSMIHRVHVTDVNHQGSDRIIIDRYLMEKVGLRNFEKVLVSDLTNGNSYETYVIAGERRSGICQIQGITALQSAAGNRLEIMAFDVTDEPEGPRMIFVDEHNRFVEYL